MEKKYQVVCYKRLEPPEDNTSLTYAEDLKDKNVHESFYPENIYRIEEIKEE